MNNLQIFQEKVKQSASDGTLLKLSFGNYKGQELGLKQLLVSLVLIKKVQKISVVYRYQTKDITKNFELFEFENLLDEWLNFDGFRASYLQTTTQKFQFEMLGKDRFKLKINEKNHNRTKNYDNIDLSQPFWHELQITDNQGVVYKNAQDKFRQINHFLELLSVPMSHLTIQNPTIVDMGSGKGYLTFALHHYFLKQQKTPQTVGVEYRSDMVQLCNSIAQNAGFTTLSFVQSSIQDFEPESIDILIALHACDTATDDALAKGIKAKSPLIVVAPCCHKQIRNEIEKGKVKNSLNAITKYGTFLERQAEMATDALRCLILNYFGYKTKVLEFVSVEHTPKNVLIIAEKTTRDKDKQKLILEEIKALKSFFGIRRHYLEMVF